jgi:hypothetical protein
MILKNKTNAFQRISDGMVRPYRTIIVSDDCEFDENIFEIEVEPNKMINKNKKNKGD